jgi:hypothetical protein
MKKNNLVKIIYMLALLLALAVTAYGDSGLAG